MKNLVVIFISKLIPLINKTYNYLKGSNHLKNNNQNTKKFLNFNWKCSKRKWIKSNEKLWFKNNNNNDVM